MKKASFPESTKRQDRKFFDTTTIPVRFFPRKRNSRFLLAGIGVLLLGVLIISSCELESWLSPDTDKSSLKSIQENAAVYIPGVDTIQFTVDPVSYRIVNSGDTLLGYLTLGADASRLYADFTLIDGWYLGSTYLYLGSVQGIPLTSEKNPDFSAFPYSVSKHEDYYTQYTYVIPFNRFPDTIVFAAYTLAWMEDFASNIWETSGWATAATDLELYNDGSLPYWPETNSFQDVFGSSSVGGFGFYIIRADTTGGGSVPPDTTGTGGGGGSGTGTVPGDTGSGGTGTGDNGSGDTGSGDTGSGDTGTGDTGSGGSGTGDTGSGDTGSGDSGNGDTGSGDGGTGGGDTGSGDTGTDTGSGDTSSGDTGGGDTGSGDGGSTGGDTGSGDTGSGDPGGSDPGSGDGGSTGGGDTGGGDTGSGDTGSDPGSGDSGTGTDPGTGDGGSDNTGGDTGSGDSGSGDSGSGGPGSDTGGGDSGSGDPGTGTGDGGSGDSGSGDNGGGDGGIQEDCMYGSSETIWAKGVSFAELTGSKRWGWGYSYSLGYPVSIDLIAGQYDPVGVLMIEDNGVNLTITYKTTTCYSLDLVHLYVGSLADFGKYVNKAGVPVPGQFPYKAGDGSKVQEFSFTIPISSLQVVENKVFIAAHGQSYKCLNCNSTYF